MSAAYSTAAEARAVILQQCRESWAGNEGQQRAARVDALLERLLPEYSAAFDIPQDELLLVIEASRKVSAVNFYQDSNFPSLKDVTVFKTAGDFRMAYPSGKFICPACGGHSNSPSDCDTGLVRDKRVCDWKAYGLFGTMGKGMRLVVQDQFMRAPGVLEIFMPVESTTATSTASLKDNPHD